MGSTLCGYMYRPFQWFFGLTFGQTAKRVALKWEAITSYTACTCRLSMAESISPGWFLPRPSLPASPPRAAKKHLSQAISHAFTSWPILSNYWQRGVPCATCNQCSRPRLDFIMQSMIVQDQPQPSLVFSSQCLVQNSASSPILLRARRHRQGERQGE